MILRNLQLVCSTAILAIASSALAQATATATENGIVSAAGSPEATQSVTYSIPGEGIVAPTTTSSQDIISPTTTSSSEADATAVGGTEQSLTNNNSHGLSTPAILGIVLAVIFAIMTIIILTIVLHRRRTRDVRNRAKRKSIMDAEFAASRGDLVQIPTRDGSVDRNLSLGYFDLAKPLPAVTEHKAPVVSASNKPIEEDRLSRSSTIIADAAEVAQINRKASGHQRRQKKSRDGQRHRNAALQILITNENNRTSVLPHSPLASNPTTPVANEPISPWRARCDDGNGDAFTKRPSKL